MTKEKYKDYIISKGGKEIGLLDSDIKNYLLTPSEYKEFSDFMRGQTCCVLGDLGGEYVSITYTGDYYRFINGLPNND